MKFEKAYYEIINNLTDGIYFLDKNRRITFWNKAAEDITGYLKDEIVGKCCQNNLLNHVDEKGIVLCKYDCPLYATILDGENRESNVFLRHKNGYRIPTKIKIFPIIENEEIVGGIEIFSPISQTTYDETLIENLANNATKDQLTGLPNRRKIESFLNYRFNELKNFNHKFCLIFLDIDDFRDINNLYGHAAGDKTLMGITKSIEHFIGKNDLFGRYGGEEFIGIFEINEDSEALAKAEMIRMLISKTEIIHEDIVISITASLGVTNALSNDTIESLINRADRLMYLSKQKSKNCVSSDITS